MAIPRLFLCLSWTVALWMVGAQAGETGIVEQWHPVAVNHEEKPYHALIIQHPEAGLAVRRLDLLMMGLELPDRQLIRHQAEWYHPVSVLDRHDVFIDELSGRVHFVSRRDGHMVEPPGRELLLTLVVNGYRLETPLHVVFEQGELMLPPDTLKRLNIDTGRVADTGPDAALSMHMLAGEHFSLDSRELELHMMVPPEFLRRRTFSADESGADAIRPNWQPSAVLSYHATEGRDSDNRAWRTLMTDLGVGTGPAMCESRQLYRSSHDSTSRLESRCVFDAPQQLFSVTLGDSISRAGVLGQPVRYGGVRIGTDFDLAPGFITQPSMTLAGSARVPSMLDVWVDQMRAVQRRIPPGPFTVTDLPAHTGAGEIRALVDDGTGDVQVISRPFYSDPSLLAPGLTDWSLAYGRQRHGVLTEDDHYGDAFASLSARHGMTDWLTLGLHAEASPAVDMGALGSSIRIGRLGVVELGAAGSRLEDGLTGGAALAGFSHRGRRFSLGVRQLSTSPDFAQLGHEQPGSAPAHTRQASLGLSLGHGASVNLGRVERRYHDDRPAELFHTAALNLSLAGQASLRFSAFQTVEPEPGQQYAAHLTIPFGQRSSLSSSAVIHEDDRVDRQVQVQTNPPVGPGFGYRASAGRLGETDTASADVTAQGDQAVLNLHGRDTGDRSSGRASLSGSVVAAGSGVFLTRSRPGGFAVVDASAPDVRVYAENRLVGTTGRNGKLVVPGMRPYEHNRLRIAVEDLPLAARLNDDTTRLVPGRRQVARADFTVDYERHLMARVVDANGDPLPVGASVQVEGSDDKTVLGRQGRLYVRVNDGDDFTARISHGDRRCSVSTALPSGDNFPQDLGTLVCRSE